MNNLEILNLAVNNFHGPSPEGLGNLANLTRLQLSVNQLSGTIPASIGDLILLDNLGLKANQLTGTIPASLGNHSNLSDIYLSANRLTGCIPAGLKRVPTHDFDGTGLAFCSSSSVSRPQGNRLVLSVVRVRDREVWSLFATLLKAQLRNPPLNWMKKAPNGDWYGVATNRDGEVTGIDLNGNNLRGSAPSVLGQLASVRQWQMELGN